jgi:hypothetical protein
VSIERITASGLNESQLQVLGTLRRKTLAVYVLLTFDDDQHAHDFVKVIVQGKYNDSGGKIWGVWKKPTQFCPGCQGGKKTSLGFTRGLKYGWWVCAKCKKPTPRWASGAHWFTVLGTNLLPRKLRPYPEEMSPTLESPAVWDDLLVGEEIPDQTS